MSMIRNIFTVIGYIVAALFVGFVTYAVLIFPMQSALTHRYWIYYGNKTTYTNKYTEKDKCIYYKDEFDNPTRQCGSYKVEDHETD